MKIIELSVNEYKEINNMTDDLLKRIDEIENENLKVGQIIPVTLNSGEKVEIVAVKDLGNDSLLCTFVDCLKDERPRTDLEDWLNNDFINDVPDNILENMLPANEHKDLFRLFTKSEVFEDEINFFKLRRNRIAFRGLNGDFEWWWLYDNDSGAYFAGVTTRGNAYYGNASTSRGVRPAFILKSKICGA